LKVKNFAVGFETKKKGRTGKGWDLRIRPASVGKGCQVGNRSKPRVIKRSRGTVRREQRNTTGKLNEHYYMQPTQAHGQWETFRRGKIADTETCRGGLADPSPPKKEEEEEGAVKKRGHRRRGNREGERD